METSTTRRFGSFAEFFPFYLQEHANRMCRRMHFIGSSLALLCLLLALAKGNGWYVLLGFAFGYGFAWIGHFGFEKNRPATFKYPLYSFAGDWVMYWRMLAGKISF